MILETHVAGKIFEGDNGIHFSIVKEVVDSCLNFIVHIVVVAAIAIRGVIGQ